VWLNGRAFARDPKGRGFKSWLQGLGKLLKRICLCHQAGLVESKMDQLKYVQQSAQNILSQNYTIA